MIDDKFSDLNIEVKIVESIGSTNDAVRELADSGLKDDYVLISEEQTKGKGRRGRSFYSPAGTGIYISLLIHPKSSVEDVQKYTTIMAVAAAVAIENVTGFDVSIKWVNDLWMRGRKICGILTETSSEIINGIPGYVISGIGINIFEPEGGFPEEIKETAGAVFTKDTDVATKASEVKFEIAAGLIRQFLKYYNSDENYLDDYKKRLFVIGKDVDILSSDHTSLNKKAKVLGINEKCHLHVRYEDGSEDFLSSGEISIKV